MEMTPKGQRRPHLARFRYHAGPVCVQQNDNLTYFQDNHGAN